MLCELCFASYDVQYTDERATISALIACIDHSALLALLCERLWLVCHGPSSRPSAFHLYIDYNELLDALFHTLITMQLLLLSYVSQSAATSFLKLRPGRIILTDEVRWGRFWRKRDNFLFAARRHEHISALKRYSLVSAHFAKTPDLFRALLSR